LHGALGFLAADNQRLFIHYHSLDDNFGRLATVDCGEPEALEACGAKRQAEDKSLSATSRSEQQVFRAIGVCNHGSHA
jgi:hypothetical protein